MCNLGLSLFLDPLHRIGERSDSLQRQELGLKGHQHRVDRDQRVQRDQPERRRAIHQHRVPALAGRPVRIVARSRQRLLEAMLAPLHVDQLDLRTRQRHRGRHDREARDSAWGRTASSIVASPAGIRRRPANDRRAACPDPSRAFPCGSRSISSTFSPTAASAVARLIAVVVLPTPPFWLAIAKIFGAVGVRYGGGRRHDRLRSQGAGPLSPSLDRPRSIRLANLFPCGKGK